MRIQSRMGWETSACEAGRRGEAGGRGEEIHTVIAVGSSGKELL